MAKEHREFHPVDLTRGWTQIEGYPDGLGYQTLASDLDTGAGTGSQTRLLRWPAGARLPEPVAHAVAEEVYLLAGDLIVIDPDTGAETVFTAPAYACRPSGVPHGPFRTESGCLMLEITYPDDR